jgi:hypothetical protein
MSRTDKTDPMWVRMMDPANRTELRIVHDHRFGPCDLHTWKPADARRSLWWRRDGGSCYMRPKPVKRLYCRCASCSGRAWNNWQGCARAEWRAQRQAWLSGWGEYRRERGARKYWYD